MRVSWRSRAGRRPPPTSGRGQALVEFAFVFPIFMALLMSIVMLGLYVFYNQQLENSARRRARFAAVNSTRAQCPTVSRIDPILSNREPDKYIRCDAPEKGWTRMIGKARASIWGMAPNQVSRERMLVRLRGPVRRTRRPPGTAQYIHRVHDRRRESH